MKYPDFHRSAIFKMIILIKTAKIVIASNFGDTKLSFQHQSIQDDVDLKPE